MPMGLSEKINNFSAENIDVYQNCPTVTVWSLTLKRKEKFVFFGNEMRITRSKN